MKSQMNESAQLYKKNYKCWFTSGIKPRKFPERVYSEWSPRTQTWITLRYTVYVYMQGRYLSNISWTNYLFTLSHFRRSSVTLLNFTGKSRIFCVFRVNNLKVTVFSFGLWIYVYFSIQDPVFQYMLNVRSFFSIC